MAGVRLKAGLVAILLRREVNVCATREAACMRLINILPSVNLEREVLDADVVVAVGATVGWTQAETTVTDCSWSRKVDDFLRTSVGRIPDLLDPSERPEQVATRIRTGLKYVAADRLVPAPDCGMKYLTREVAFGKLKALADGAAIVRKELG